MVWIPPRGGAPHDPRNPSNWTVVNGEYQLKSTPEWLGEKREMDARRAERDALANVVGAIGFLAAVLGAFRKR